MIKPTKRTVRAAIRASVPDGKLKNSRVLVADVSQGASPIGGYTKWERDNGGRIIEVGVPIGDNAFGISIKAHEAGHASHHKPTRKKPITQNEAIASQIVDDVNVELVRLPNVRGLRPYQRAKLAVAMRDLRSIVNMERKVRSGKIPDTGEVRNAHLLGAVRTLAMIRHYATGEVSEIQVSARAVNKLREVIGRSALSAVSRVVELAKYRRKRASAIDMLVSLMENDPPDVSEDEADRREREGNEILLPPVGGNAIDGKMRIIDLRPKSAFCAKEKTISRRYSPDGVMINPTRFVNAIAGGNGAGLFSRRVKEKPGGCVVIDASGSMGANRSNLTALCELVPTATVAFYSGGARGIGDLVIYAREGRRYSGELPKRYLHGGNAVDLPAVKWLLEHGKPWTLVSDLEFCGGVTGSEEIAHALVERHVKRGELKVYRSLDSAFEAFGGKGSLRDAKRERRY